MTESEKEGVKKGDAPVTEEDTPKNLSEKERLRRVGSDEKLPFTIHLEELRTRIIYCAVTVFLVFAVLYSVSDALFNYFRQPMGEYGLIAIAPTEAFFAFLKVSFYLAIIISVPMLLYHSWEFVAPGLLESERRYTGWFVVVGTLFFGIGSSFCYFIVLPFGLDFLLSFGGDDIVPQISANNYISFMFKMIIAFGMIFELPLVIVFLTMLGIVTPEDLASKRPFFIVGSFVVAAILTPPDVFTQAIMALPMIILFELSLIFSKIFIKPKGADDL